MKAWILAVTGILVALVLTACGGSGGQSFSSLAGNYQGTYQILNNGSQESAGNLNLAIDNAGNVSGTMQRTDKNPETVILRNGFIQNDGRTIRFTFKYSDTNDRIVTGEIELVGTTLEPANNNGNRELDVQIAGGGTLKLRFLTTRQ